MKTSNKPIKLEQINKQAERQSNGDKPQVANGSHTRLAKEEAIFEAFL